jgi:hypothetical protein
MDSIPIDWASVNWLYVALLAVFVFITSLVGDLLTFNHRGYGALLSALLFAVAFIFWTYYPHGLPLPTSLTPKATVTTTAPPPVAPAAPVKPANPVTDVTPPAKPANPITDVTPPATNQQ